MPGSVINQPERLKRLESPFSLFLCGVAAGRCSSYLDSLATDATHVPRSCCCEQRSSFFFFFFTHFFSSPLHFSQPSFLLLLLLFLCSTREREIREKDLDLQEWSSFGIDDKSAHGRTRVYPMPTLAVSAIGGVYGVLSLCKWWICLKRMTTREAIVFANIVYVLQGEIPYSEYWWDICFVADSRINAWWSI